MVNFERRDDEMSMEDILASIRKYVSEDENKSKAEEKTDNVEPPQGKEETVISLSETQIVNSESKNSSEEQSKESSTVPEEDPVTYSEISSLSMNTISEAPSYSHGDSNPFSKLADALKVYGEGTKHQEKTDSAQGVTIDVFLRDLAGPLISQWIKENLPKIVEEMIDREIQKLKNL